MADQQPGDAIPAAGLPDDGVPDADRAHLDAARTEPSTVNAPMRWSGAAAVRPPEPKRSWWSRRSPAAETAEPGSDDPTDWATTPAVDPWAGHDTPWDPMSAVPEELPPTRLDPGRTPPAPAPTTPAPAGPASAVPTRQRRWGRRKRRGPTEDRVTDHRRPFGPAPAGSPAATPGAPPNTPGIPAAPAGRPSVPATWRPRTSGPPTTHPAWQPPAARPLPAPAGRPPGGRPPAGPPSAAPWVAPAPPRRRRRWPRRLALVTLLGVACCCGVPAAYFTWIPAGQFPVTAVLPQRVADLNLRDDGASRRAVERLKQQLRDANALGDVFAGVYADSNGKRVTLFGTTGLRLAPKADVEAELRRLAGQFGLRDVQPYDLDETGVHERCGVGSVDGAAVVVCAWADHGSLGTIVANRRSVRDSAALTGIFRNAVLTRPAESP